MTEGQPPRARQEFTHDVPELEEDLAYEREVLDESIKHDYSTSDTGIVPLNRRRPTRPNRRRVRALRRLRRTSSRSLPLDAPERRTAL